MDSASHVATKSDILTLDDVARELRISRWLVQTTLVRKNLLKTFRVGGRRLCTRTALDGYIARAERDATSSGAGRTTNPLHAR